MIIVKVYIVRMNLVLSVMGCDSIVRGVVILESEVNMDWIGLVRIFGCVVIRK